MVQMHWADRGRFRRHRTLNWTMIAFLATNALAWAGIIRVTAPLLSKIAF